ncbi:nucleoside/nucleotide kinase family protein [Lysobacter korlensis]|uniref:Nucleoside/nucleotide kinase family protein n=1 Tax=Lysobacter korlensis TaxID=553636 RepID=A0ABV6RU10_9GAMM
MAVIGGVDEVVTSVRDAAAGSGRTVVGIAGAPGAGKSTLAARLVERLGAEAALLPMDGFHLPQRRLVDLGRRDRMGAPDTFDVPGFLHVLRRVRANDGAVPAPGFDRTVEEPVPDAIRIGPEHTVVVVEGNYLLLDSGGWEGAAGLLDVTFYVEVPRDVRLRRLIDRHVAFGKSPEAAEAWALGPDERNAELIAGTASRARHRVVLT